PSAQPTPSGSEHESQTELHGPGRLDRQDTAEIRSRDVDDGSAQTDAVGRVKHIRAETQIVAFRKPQVFGDRKIEIPIPGAAQRVLAYVAGPDRRPAGASGNNQKGGPVQIGELVGSIQVRIATDEIRTRLQKRARLDHI